MYAVGWASNCVAVVDPETGLIEEYTLESVIHSFEDQKEVKLCSGLGLGSSAKILDMKVVERRGIGMNIKLFSCDNPAVIPENAQVLIRRLVSKLPLPGPFGYNLPPQLYSSPFYVKASTILDSDLIGTPDHYRASWFGNSVRILTGGCRYRAPEWLKFTAAYPKSPLRYAIIPGTDKHYDGITTPSSAKTWLRITDIREIRMDSLVALTVDSPGGVICDGVIVQAMVGSCAKVP
jgi:hypothetical protein